MRHTIPSNWWYGEKPEDVKCPSGFRFREGNTWLSVTREADGARFLVWFEKGTHRIEKLVRYRQATSSDDPNLKPGEWVLDSTETIHISEDQR